MKLEIVILCWNDVTDTHSCISQIDRWRPPNSRIWVVDNGSSPAFDPAESDVVLIRNDKNLGFSGGVNTALRRDEIMASDSVLLLNTDATLTEAGAAELMGQFAAHPEVAAMSPALCEHDKNGDAIYHGARSISRHIATRVRVNGSRAEAVVPIDFLSGTAFLCRPSALRKVGLLEERYFFSGEIADLCQRMRNAGLTCAVCTSSQVLHDLSCKAHQRSSIHLYYSLRNRFLFVRTHEAAPMRPLLFLFWTAIGCAMAIRAVMSSEVAQARSAARAVKDGLLGHYGPQSSGH